MIYFLLGDDTHAKDQKIEELKKKYLPSADSYLFDYDSLQAQKLDASTFKKSLLNLPAVSDFRLVLLRFVQKLDQQNKDILLEIIATKPKYLILVLEAESGEASNAFIKKLEAVSQVFKFGEKTPSNVFDMTKAIEQKNLSAAQKILFELFEAGQHPLQLMSVIVWFWGKQRSKVSAKKFNEGLLALQEADLNIKRSKLIPTQAMEVLLTKLYLLQAG